MPNLPYPTRAEIRRIERGLGIVLIQHGRCYYHQETSGWWRASAGDLRYALTLLEAQPDRPPWLRCRNWRIGTCEPVSAAMNRKLNALHGALPKDGTPPLEPLLYDVREALEYSASATFRARVARDVRAYLTALNEDK